MKTFKFCLLGFGHIQHIIVIYSTLKEKSPWSFLGPDCNLLCTPWFSPSFLFLTSGNSDFTLIFYEIKFYRFHIWMMLCVIYLYCLSFNLWTSVWKIYFSIILRLFRINHSNTVHCRKDSCPDLLCFDSFQRINTLERVRSVHLLKTQCLPVSH